MAGATILPVFSRTRPRINPWNKNKLNFLKEDPYYKRSGADIKRIIDTNPILYRLKVRDYRVIYAVEDDIIWITDIFYRSKGYL